MQRRIVICGSMANYSDIRQCYDRLRGDHISCLVPEPDDENLLRHREKYLEFKRQISWNYLNEITKQETFGILVVNTPKKGIPHYIGANAFAEIAVAFSSDKRIYLYDGIYETYSDELLAWGAVALGMNLSRLIQDFSRFFLERPSADACPSGGDLVFAGGTC